MAEVVAPRHCSFQRLFVGECCDVRGGCSLPNGSRGIADCGSWTELPLRRVRRSGASWTLPEQLLDLSRIGFLYGLFLEAFKLL